MDLLSIAKLWLSIGLIKKANAEHSHSYGPVQSDGYQYCDQCGVAATVSCQHKWEKEAEFSRSSGDRTTAIVTRLRCIKCGERKEHEIRA